MSATSEFIRGQTALVTLVSGGFNTTVQDYNTGDPVTDLATNSIWGSVKVTATGALVGSGLYLPLLADHHVSIVNGTSSTIAVQASPTDPYPVYVSSGQVAEVFCDGKQYNVLSTSIGTLTVGAANTVATSNGSTLVWQTINSVNLSNNAVTLGKFDNTGAQYTVLANPAAGTPTWQNNPVVLSMQVLQTSGFFGLQSGGANSGRIRLANLDTISWRNYAGSADIAGIFLDANNNINIGPSSGIGGWQLITPAGTTLAGNIIPQLTFQAGLQQIYQTGQEVTFLPTGTNLNKQYLYDATSLLGIEWQYPPNIASNSKHGHWSGALSGQTGPTTIPVYVGNISPEWNMLSAWVRVRLRTNDGFLWDMSFPIDAVYFSTSSTRVEMPAATLVGSYQTPSWQTAGVVGGGSLILGTSITANITPYSNNTVNDLVGFNIVLGGTFGGRTVIPMIDLLVQLSHTAVVLT